MLRVANIPEPQVWTYDRRKFFSLATFVNANFALLPEEDKDSRKERLRSLRTLFIPDCSFTGDYENYFEDEVFNHKMLTLSTFFAVALDSRRTRKTRVAVCLDACVMPDGDGWLCFRIAAGDITQEEECLLMRHAKRIVELIHKKQPTKASSLARMDRLSKIIRQKGSDWLRRASGGAPTKSSPPVKFLYKYWMPAFLERLETHSARVIAALAKLTEAKLADPYMFIYYGKEYDPEFPQTYKRAKRVVDNSCGRQLDAMESLRTEPHHGNWVDRIINLVQAGTGVHREVLRQVVVKVAHESTNSFKSCDAQIIMEEYDFLNRYKLAVDGLLEIRDEFGLWSKWSRLFEGRIDVSLVPKNVQKAPEEPPEQPLPIEDLICAALPAENAEAYNSIQGPRTSTGSSGGAQAFSQTASRYINSPKVTRLFEHSEMRLTRFYLEHADPPMADMDPNWPLHNCSENRNGVLYSPIMRKIGLSSPMCYMCETFLNQLRGCRLPDYREEVYGLACFSASAAVDICQWMPPDPDINARSPEEAEAWRKAIQETERAFKVDTWSLADHDMARFRPKTRTGVSESVPESTRGRRGRKRRWKPYDRTLLRRSSKVRHAAEGRLGPGNPLIRGWGDPVSITRRASQKTLTVANEIRKQASVHGTAPFMGQRFFDEGESSRRRSGGS